LGNIEQNLAIQYLKYVNRDREIFMDKIFSTKELCRLLRVSRTSIAKYAKLGMPRESRGRWKVFLAHDWWLENIVGMDQNNGAPETSELSQAKLKWYQARAEAAEFKLEIEKGNYYSTDQIKSSWIDRIGIVRAGLINFCDRISPMLTGKTQDQIYKTIREEVNRLLADFARSSRLTPSSPEVRQMIKDIDRRYPGNTYLKKKEKKT
jgi:hypothetical protein